MGSVSIFVAIDRRHSELNTETNDDQRNPRLPCRYITLMGTRFGRGSFSAVQSPFHSVATLEWTYAAAA